MPEDLCEYEKERNLRIARNQEMLRHLGLEGGAKLTMKPPRSAAAAHRKRSSPPPPPKTDRSLRQRTNKPARAEAAADSDAGADEQQKRRRKVSALVALGEPPEKLEELPEDLALLEESKGDPSPQQGGIAFVKHMLPSHVTGGYWLQSPQGLCDVMPQQTCDIHLRVGGSIWEITYLVRGKQSGAGLSGGWRGFAVDQRLCVGDAVVFHVRDERRPRIVDCYLYRAHLFGGEQEALDAAFELADAIAPDEDGERRALPEVAPSPPTRPALHWHSVRAKHQRRELPEAVRQHATWRVDRPPEECERYARLALEPPSSREEGSPLLLLPPPEEVGGQLEAAGEEEAAEEEAKAEAAPETMDVEAREEHGEERPLGRKAKKREAAAAEAEGTPPPSPSPPPTPTEAVLPPAQQQQPPQREQKKHEQLGLRPLQKPPAEALVAGAVLWGAPLSRGRPHPEEFGYFLLVSTPSAMDADFSILAVDGPHSRTSSRPAPFRMLRCDKPKLLRCCELATATHPCGGLHGAEVAALQAEAESRRAAGLRGERRR